VAVPDDGSFYSFYIEVSGLPNAIDLSFGIERICMNFYHSWDADVQMWLIAPDGTQVELSTDNGGSEDGYINTCFTENAFFSITSGAPPFTGTYNPEGNLNDINNSQNPNGTWTLLFWDTYWFADSGWLYEWSLTFTDEVLNPEPDPFQFEFSNLPLVYINTAGQGIPDEPGVIAYMQVIDNGEGNLNYKTDPFTYEGTIDIELRGQSTMGFPKKSYGLETKDNFGNDLDTTFLGLPADEDWILYSPYSEKSLLQNALSMDLGRAMGDYHSRTRYCELYVNDVYDGIYLLMEKIKQENDRVDIADLNVDENTGEDLTGGYIFRLDWGGDTGWQSEFALPVDPNAYPWFQFVYPRPEIVTPEQRDYLEAYVDSFEYAINDESYMFGGKRYDKYIDLASFVDNFIVNELSKNVDAYRLSSYYSKDKNGKIIAGPLWDFNLSFGNADYCDGADDNDWNFQVCGTSGPSWWPRMWQDSVFTNLLKCRWDYLRTNLLSNESMEARIDSMAAHLTLEGAVDRNFLRWQILGVYVWPNALPYPVTYDEAIWQLKTWTVNRMAWMDANIIGNPMCVPYLVNNAQNVELFEEQNFPPNCWTTSDADGDGATWQGNAPVGGYESIQSVYSNSFGTFDPDSYFVSPQLTPIGGEHITWYAASQLEETSEHYQVLLSTTGIEAGDFTTILWEETISGDEWQYRAADLSAWWGQNIYIAFRHFNSANNFQLRIDEIRYPTWTNPAQDCTIGVEESNMTGAFSLWPNPADDKLTVHSTQPIGHIRMCNVIGEVVMERSFNENRHVVLIDVKDLSAGIYSLQVNGKAGVKVVVESR